MWCGEKMLRELRLNEVAVKPTKLGFLLGVNRLHYARCEKHSAAHVVSSTGVLHI